MQAMITRNIFLILSALCLAQPATGQSLPDEIDLSTEPGAALLYELAIEGAGYYCPKAKFALPRGADEHGPIVYVWCGPADQEGVYQRGRYRVTITDGRSYIVPAPIL